MANGGRGDHPISDILDHGLAVFSPTADELVRRIARLVPRYRMWDLIDWFAVPPIPELEGLLARRLAELEEEACQRGWDLDTDTSD
ncbi:MAG: hypothetical protein ABL963_14195 [Longimicrobiales bacterium]